MATMNESLVAPLDKNATSFAHRGNFRWIDGLLFSYQSGWNGWQVAATVLIILVAYDQRTPPAILEAAMRC
jgi:hypothetical protein